MNTNYPTNPNAKPPASLVFSRRKLLIGGMASGLMTGALARLPAWKLNGAETGPSGTDFTAPASVSGYGPQRQLEIYQAGLSGQKPSLPVAFEQLREQAREKLSVEAFGYVHGSAGGGATHRANLAAFHRWQIVPRYLSDVSERDLRVTVLGQPFPVPIGLAPVGVQGILHPEGELATARAARSLGLPMVLSTLSSRPLEAVAEVLGATPRWFQLYWPKDSELAASLVHRAERSGYRAIVVTLDSGYLGWREMDLQSAYLPFLKGEGLANFVTDPVFTDGLQSVSQEDRAKWIVQKFLKVGTHPALQWSDLKSLREKTGLPIVLKGILHPEDARKALDHGVDGMIVSNHGGRQVDGAIPSLDALLHIVKAAGNRTTVMFDSGIRRGNDVLKALALGARCVFVGRPYCYGLALNGEQGVRDVMKNLLADVDLNLALSGAASIKQFNREYLIEAVSRAAP